MHNRILRIYVYFLNIVIKNDVKLYKQLYIIYNDFFS